MITNPNFTNEFPEDVTSNLPNVCPTGAGSYETLKYAVSVTSMMAELSEALATGISVRTVRDTLSASDIERMLTNLVRFRCLQVAKRLPATIRTSEILVPDFFFPFLARITRVDLPLLSYQFVPEWSIEDLETAEEPQNGRDAREETLRMSEEADFAEKTCLKLKQCNVRVSRGLPKSLESSDDGLLRICETAKGELLAAGGSPAETDLLIRSVIRIGFRPECFGEARTRYSRVEDYRASLYRIVDAAYQRIG